MFTHTKIVCTIGPAVSDYEQMLALIDAGMNVARLNFSHGTHEEHAKNIKNLKKAREEKKVPLALMLDMQGPNIRLGKIEGGSQKVRPGEVIKLVEKGEGIPFHPAEVASSLNPGMTVLFDDGYIIGTVVAAKSKEIHVEIQNSGVLKSGKSINLPGANVPLPAMTKEDFEDLKFGCKHGIDCVAASFIRSAHHVLSIKKFLGDWGGASIPVIAKIESTQGVDHFDSIVQVADGIMVARGDLGVEMDLSVVPKLQKMMIRKSYMACKSVITATQMLESMIQNPRPTRAEVSDVANAIYDCSSSVMLSAETAVGKNPIETVTFMKKIIQEAESDFDYRQFFDEHSRRDYHDIPSVVALAAVKTAYSCNAKAIFAVTASGATARAVSHFRPKMPIIAVTPEEKHYHLLGGEWGVLPLLLAECASPKEAFKAAAKFALDRGIIHFGDVVVFITGVPFGLQGSTNTMTVESIGNVIVKGNLGFGAQVSGHVFFLLSGEEHTVEQVEGKLCVLTHCDESFLPLLKGAKGIILQNSIGDVDSEKYAMALAKTYHLSIITRADRALELLKNGEEVTIDPKRRIIYRGHEESMMQFDFGL